MFGPRRHRMSFAQVLQDRSAAGVAEGLVGITLIFIVIALLGTAVAQHGAAVAGIATKAERQKFITTLVDTPYARAKWGTPAAPVTKDETLPDGTVIKVTTWVEETATSSRITAITPAKSGEGGADCASPSAVIREGCISATASRAHDVDQITPPIVIRKDMSGADNIGQVNTAVAQGELIPQGTVIAKFAKTDKTTVWRYMIVAGSESASGAEITISNANRIASTVRLTQEPRTYFGTFEVPADQQTFVKASYAGVYVSDILIYKAAEAQ